MSYFFEMLKFKSEIPPLYGSFHICFLFIALFFCTVGVWIASKLSKKAGDRLIFFCGIILTVFEIFKQLFYYYNVGKGSYVWTIFPFQICSLPMYICLFITFIKDGKLKKILYDFLFIISTVGGLLVLLVPMTTMTSYTLINIHSFVWHIILLFLGIFVVVTGRAELKIKDYFNSLIAFLPCVLIAFLINCIFSQASDNTITMFFVGPNIPQVVIIKDIALTYGWLPASVLYLILICFGGLLFFCIGNIIEKAVNKIRESKKN